MLQQQKVDSIEVKFIFSTLLLSRHFRQTHVERNKPTANNNNNKKINNNNAAEKIVKLKETTTIVIVKITSSKITWKIIVTSLCCWLNERWWIRFIIFPLISTLCVKQRRCRSFAYSYEQANK